MERRRNNSRLDLTHLDHKKQIPPSNNNLKNKNHKKFKEQCQKYKTNLSQRKLQNKRCHKALYK